MSSSLKRFKRKAFARPGVEAAYDELAEEFAFLDEVLRARAEAGLTQAEVAKANRNDSVRGRAIGVGHFGHSPSIASLQRYARALGCHVEVRFVKNRRRAQPDAQLRLVLPDDVGASAGWLKRSSEYALLHHVTPRSVDRAPSPQRSNCGIFLASTCPGALCPAAGAMNVAVTTTPTSEVAAPHADAERGAKRVGRHVPRILQQHIADDPGTRWWTHTGTAAFVDVSGFTNLSEQLAKKGREGAEQITEVIGSCFDSILQVAYESGGSLLKFGGDALLALVRRPRARRALRPRDARGCVRSSTSSVASACPTPR